MIMSTPLQAAAPIPMFAKKRIEIFVEAPALHRLIDKLDQAGVTGYTVLPALAGRGSEGSWNREGLAGEAGRLVCVICIVDPSKVNDVVARIYSVLSRQIGIVTVGDVQVIRGNHF
jgi:PII-like signaling protein